MGGVEKKTDPDHVRDTAGPRGYLRFEIPIGAYHKHYHDLSTARIGQVQMQQKKEGHR